jgi:hypothetical protein
MRGSVIVVVQFGSVVLITISLSCFITGPMWYSSQPCISSRPSLVQNTVHYMSAEIDIDWDATPTPA